MMPLEMGDKEEKKRKPPPIVTNLLLLSTVLIQIYLLAMNQADAERLYETYSLVPFDILNGVRVDSLFTYIFLHGSLLHLIVNSVALYGAGVIVERDLGHLRYLLVFLISGVVAGLAHSFLNPYSRVPLVGSSGAIFGVIAVLFLLMPFKLTFALVFPLPSVLVGIMLVIVELSAFWMANDFGIAHDAHIAGFIMGGVCAFAIDQKRAVKGLIVAAIVLAMMYYAGVYFGLIPA